MTVKQKALNDIKFGQSIFTRLNNPNPVTYDQLFHSLGIAPKQLQKALADLCKAGYVEKTIRGYKLTELGQNQQQTPQTC